MIKSFWKTSNIYRILILLPFFCAGQISYKQETINSNDGLPSDFVTHTAKKDGYIYVGTQRGLCLYDGYRCVKSKTVTSPTNSLEVNKNHLYFYSNAMGLCSISTIFDNPKIISGVHFSDSIPNNDHYDNVFTDRESRVWSTDRNNLKYFVPGSDLKGIYRIDPANPQQDLYASFVEPNASELWVFTRKGLLVWDKKSKRIKQNEPHFFDSLNVVSAEKINDWLYMVLRDGTLFAYNLNNKQAKKYQQFYNQDVKLADGYMQHTDGLLLHNDTEVFTFNTTTQKKQRIFNTTAKINHVFYDSETKITWISTNTGLVKLSQITTAVATHDLPLKSRRQVVAVAEDHSQRIWAVSMTNEVFCYTETSGFKTYSIPDKNTQCNGLFAKDDKIYIIANSGVFIIENTHVVKLLSSETTIKKVIADHKNQLWVMPEKGKIKVYDLATLAEKKNEIRNTDSYWRDNTFNDMATDSRGVVWLASWMPKSYGISFFDSQAHQFSEIDGLKNFKNSPAFVTDYYNRIAFTKSGNILFSGYGGWNLVNPKGKIIHSLNTEKYQVANDHIEGIAEDARGNIWFASAEGLNLYNFKINKVKRISKVDGLKTNDLTNGFVMLKNGKICIGTDTGIQIIDPDMIMITPLINKLALTSIKKDNIFLFNNNTSVTLDHDDTELDLSFSALSFSDHKKIVYRYRFEGESQWNFLGNIPNLSLIKLSPGTYNIIISAGDNLGHWQNKTLTVQLKVIPPFYNTIWFYTIVLFLFIAVGYFVSRYLVKQERIKGMLEQKIKNVEMQTLRSQMNPHFIFNTLNSINSYIIQNKKEIASEYLTTFSKLIRNILDLSKHETVTLSKEVKTLTMYMELEALRLERKFDYSVVVDKRLAAEDIYLPPLIIQPFVENAIWHGIHNKKAQGNIYVLIAKSSDNRLLITVEDDGIGRKASALLKTEQISHKSYGIAITIDRLQLLEASNKVIVTDLYDSDGQAHGTKVSIEIAID